MRLGSGSLSVSIWAAMNGFRLVCISQPLPGSLDGGGALKGFWERAIVVPDEGRPAIAFVWYQDFIEFILGVEAYT